MVNSNSRLAEVISNYDRVESIADGIVHAIGVSLGLAGTIVVIAANSPHTAEISSIAVYSDLAAGGALYSWAWSCVTPGRGLLCVA
jgi:ABC-type sulfate transport system permease component